MRATLSTAAVVLSALQLASAQTFTDCNPTKKTCPADPGIGSSKPFFTDFTTVQGTSAPDGWSYAQGTTMSYDSNGANFKITTKTGAPTISTTKYIMFGKVSFYGKASPGVGIVSSVILESDDLDEIDWEWLGGTDTSVESNFFGKGNVATYDRAVYHPLSAAITGWHTYTIDWNKDAIKWSIDGAVVRTLAYNDPKTQNGQYYPQTPMKIKMGNWVGCADAAAAADPKTQGTCQWAGGPATFDANTVYTMYVKNITIEDAGCGGDYTYTDMSGSYQSIKSSNEGPNCGASGSSSSSPSGSSSAASSVASSAAASPATSGGILAQTSASPANATTSAPSASGTGSGSGSGSASNGTTLATAPTSPGAGATTKPSGSAPASASSSVVSASAASDLKPKHKYGMVDLTVMIMGLGFGYLVM